MAHYPPTFSNTPRDSRLWALLVLCSAAVFSPAAWACKVRADADTRTHAERRAQAPLSFIGTVLDVKPNQVTFAVQHMIRGAYSAMITVEADTASSCTHRYLTGQRWLYAGTFVADGSALLIEDARGRQETDFGSLQRTPDAYLAFPRAWQSCTINAECRPVFAGCRITAANQASHSQAQDKAIKLAGDHRAMNCASPANPDGIGAQCIQQRCGIWAFHQATKP